MKIKLFRRLRKRAKLAKSHDSRYYHQENVIKDKADLVVTLNPLPQTNGYKAKKTFSYNRQPLEEITQKSLKSRLGSPSYILWNHEEIPKHKVYYYRDHIGLYKFLMQYHFFNNQFFFASTRISAQNRLTPKDKTEIVNQLLKKYLDKKPVKTMDDFEIKLIDKNNNLIYTYDTVYFYINYLLNNDTSRLLAEKLGVNKDNGPDFEKLEDEINELI